MKSWQLVRAFAGAFILVSLLLGVPASPLYLSTWWLGLAAFVGANLLQSAFTQWCPLELILRRLGVRGGC
ncbi:MAG TPA: DUF2892 domain-containing protein [Burkholderiaceae bacterium]